LDPDVVVTQFQVGNLNVFYPDVIFHAKSGIRTIGKRL